MSVEKYAKNAALMSGGINPVLTNNPTTYAHRQKQYFDPETRAFTLAKARYSSDFLEARVQGLETGDPNEWGTYRLRFADVVRASSAIQRRFDDYKIVLFESPKIEYIRLGTKIETMGSTWLATNPINVSGASGSGVVRRCNAVWNHLDYYGNVISEPIIVENDRANANDSDAQQSILVTKGYFNVICQYNDETRQIDTNTRMILGTAAYRVTGFADFETEFTGDYDSVRLLYFTVRYEEPNDAIDDMVNHVAGGKTFTWDIVLGNVGDIPVGGTAKIDATSYKNGEKLPNTPENPLFYLWESSDETVATVDYDGNVTAVSEGDAIITATLVQNENWTARTFINVTDVEDGVVFQNSVPQTLSAYEYTRLHAAYFEDGEEQDDALTWTFTGADTTAYAASVSADTKMATVECYGYSATPLTVTVSCNGYTRTAQIALEGI